jgi:hypothetical protein
MDTKELKFLLKLLGSENYRSPISKIKPNDKTTATERDRICRELCRRELVACSYEVTKLQVTPAGKNLLQVDAAELPLSAHELKVMRSCQKEKITPGKTGVPAAERQTIIQSLADRGLIETETKIKEVWISERGLESLRDEYIPEKRSNLTLSSDMLTNYLRFLRKSLRGKPEPVSNSAPTTVESAIETIINISDDEVLETIRQLDQEFGTENYLPIFYLRQKLQPHLSREELDQALYRLQGDNHIELSTLAEPDKFNDEQLDAGISQRRGGVIFFITVN